MHQINEWIKDYNLSEDDLNKFNELTNLAVENIDFLDLHCDNDVEEINYEEISNKDLILLAHHLSSLYLNFLRRADVIRPYVERKWGVTDDPRSMTVEIMSSIDMSNSVKRDGLIVVSNIIERKIPVVLEDTYRWFYFESSSYGIINESNRSKIYNIVEGVPEWTPIRPVIS
jgi:hypothetical protein